MATLFQLLIRAVTPHRLKITPASKPEQMAGDLSWRPPLAVESLPDIDFPKSLQKLQDVNFWIESSLIVDADGAVRNIHVPSGFALTFQQRSFFEGVLPRLKPKQARLVQDELFGRLQSQIQEAKFKPRSENANEFPMNVYIKSHFRYEGQCQKIETFVQTPSDVIFTQTSINRDDCLDLKD